VGCGVDERESEGEGEPKETTARRGTGEALAIAASCSLFLLRLTLVPHDLEVLERLESVAVAEEQRNGLLGSAKLVRAKGVTNALGVW